jgi:hypothetical protein
MAKTLYDKAIEKIREYEDKSSLNPAKRGKLFQTFSEMNKWDEHLAHVSLHIKLDTLLQHLNAEEEATQPEQ